MLLGGQHFVAALLTVRNKMLRDQGVDEEDLPVCYKYCYTLVLSMDAPWAACRSAAGCHQSQQHDSIETSTSDVCQLMLELLLEKKEKTGTPYLTDSEIYGALMTCGVVRGSSGALMSGKSGDIISTDEALEFNEKQVCSLYQRNNTVVDANDINVLLKFTFVSVYTLLHLMV